MPETKAQGQFPARTAIITGVVFVVVTGTIVLTWRLVDTCVRYQHKADEHAQEAAIHEANRAGTVPPWSDDEARKAEYHMRMNRKWEYASTHPWIQVEPDPPPPR